MYRMRTVNDWYRLQTKPGLNGPALLRWEYGSEFSPEMANTWRQHVHMNARLTVDADSLDLNRTHLPTGWVTMEESDARVEALSRSPGRAVRGSRPF